MLVLGLTGAIASGKSTTAAFFAAAGAAVFDADAAVHRLYASGPAATLVEAAFPGVAINGRVDRGRLAARVVGDHAALARLEALIHPLVRELEAAFLDAARSAGRRLAVLDIPLLFEGGRERGVDTVVVTATSDAERRVRALARPGMTASRLDSIEARQLPASEKRRRAHFVVDTGRGLVPAQQAVRDILRALAATAAAR